MTVNDDTYPPLVYTIKGKNSSMKLEIRSILYGYLNYQLTEENYKESWDEFLDVSCQDLMEIVLETTDIEFQECFEHFIKVRKICSLLHKRYMEKYLFWE